MTIVPKPIKEHRVKVPHTAHGSVRYLFQLAIRHPTVSPRTWYYHLYRGENQPDGHATILFMGGVQLLRNQLVLMSSDLYLACLKEMGVVVPADTVSNATATDSGNSTGGEIPTDEMLRCFSRHLSPEVGSREFSRTVLLVYAAALVFFMQAGFAMVCAGAVRKKNVQNTMLKNLLDACGAAVAYFVVGYAFAFGGMDLSSSAKTFVGNRNFFLMDVDDMAFWLFQYAFSAASATIVAGTLAERCQMAAYLCYSAMLAGWVYPIVAHAVWNANGFLSAYSIEPLWGVGMLDFAGSGVVHLTGEPPHSLPPLYWGPDEDASTMKPDENWIIHEILWDIPPRYR